MGKKNKKKAANASTDVTLSMQEGAEARSVSAGGVECHVSSLIDSAITSAVENGGSATNPDEARHSAGVVGEEQEPQGATKKKTRRGGKKKKKGGAGSPTEDDGGGEQGGGEEGATSIEVGILPPSPPSPGDGWEKVSPAEAAGVCAGNQGADDSQPLRPPTPPPSRSTSSTSAYSATGVGNGVAGARGDGPNSREGGVNGGGGGDSPSTNDTANKGSDDGMAEEWQGLQGKTRDIAGQLDAYGNGGDDDTTEDEEELEGRNYEPNSEPNYYEDSESDSTEDDDDDYEGGDGGGNGQDGNYDDYGDDYSDDDADEDDDEDDDGNAIAGAFMEDPDAVLDLLKREYQERHGGVAPPEGAVEQWREMLTQVVTSSGGGGGGGGGVSGGADEGEEEGEASGGERSIEDDDDDDVDEGDDYNNEGEELADAKGGDEAEDEKVYLLSGRKIHAPSTADEDASEENKEEEEDEGEVSEAIDSPDYVGGSFDGSGLTANQVRYLLSTRPREEVEELMAGTEWATEKGVDLDDDDYFEDDDNEERSQDDEDDEDYDDSGNDSSNDEDSGDDEEDADEDEDDDEEGAAVYVEGAIVESMVDDFVAEHGKVPPEALVEQWRDEVADYGRNNKQGRGGAADKEVPSESDSMQSEDDSEEEEDGENEDGEIVQLLIENYVGQHGRTPPQAVVDVWWKQVAEYSNEHVPPTEADASDDDDDSDNNSDEVYEPLQANVVEKEVNLDDDDDKDDDADDDSDAEEDESMLHQIEKYVQTHGRGPPAAVINMWRQVLQQQKQQLKEGGNDDDDDDDDDDALLEEDSGGVQGGQEKEGEEAEEDEEEYDADELLLGGWQEEEHAAMAKQQAAWDRALELRQNERQQQQQKQQQQHQQHEKGKEEDQRWGEEEEAEDLRRRKQEEEEEEVDDLPASTWASRWGSDSAATKEGAKTPLSPAERREQYVMALLALSELKREGVLPPHHIAAIKDLVLSDDISVLGAIKNLEDTKSAMVKIAQGAEADSQDSGRQTGDGTGRHSTWYSMA